MNELMNHPLVEKARVFMIAAHEAVCQKRKYSDEPYWIHPLEVAMWVSETPGATPEQVAGALLHDVVEDTGVTIETIIMVFGAQVGRIVAGLTDVSKPEDGNRAVRKAIDRDHTAAQAPDVKTNKLADVKSNFPSIVMHDPGFAHKWVGEKRDLLPYLKEGDPQLYADVEALVADFYKAR